MNLQIDNSGTNLNKKNRRIGENDQFEQKKKNWREMLAMGEATKLRWCVQQSPNTYTFLWCYP